MSWTELLTLYLIFFFLRGLICIHLIAELHFHLSFFYDLHVETLY